jgi:hypothetical protein
MSHLSPVPRAAKTFGTVRLGDSGYGFERPGRSQAPTRSEQRCRENIALLPQAEQSFFFLMFFSDRPLEQPSK